MKKNKSLLAVLLLTAFSISACSLLPQTSRRSKSSQVSEAEIEMPEAYQIYQLYLSSGGTLTYEEWLESVRGEPGQDGHSPVVTIGNNGHWYIDGNDTGINAQGEQGEQGSQGPQGDKGDTGDKGDDGKSAYEQYLEAHPDYTKSEEEWLDDLINGRLGVQASYTVSFNANGGTEVASQTIYHGEKASKPADPVKAGYTFDGWYYNGEPWSFGGHVVTSDMMIEAHWKAIDYVAIFYNDDGTILDQQDNVHYGERLAYQGATPVKPNPEDHYLYTFTGWDKELTVDGDMVFTAQYSKEYAPFEERYLDAEGNVIYNRFIRDEGSLMKLTFNNQELATIDGQYRLEAEDGLLSNGIQICASNNASGGKAIGYFRDGYYVKYDFSLTQSISALMSISVSNGSYDKINNHLSITINGEEYSISDDATIKDTNDWDIYKESTIGKVQLRNGQNTIIVTSKGGINMDYLGLSECIFDLSQEGVETPSKAKSNGLKYCFRNWVVVSDVNNVLTYSPYYMEATDGLEFAGEKVDVYHGSAKDVTIPEWWNGYSITVIGRQSFAGSDIKTVSLPNTITFIDERAFDHCESLVSINLPSSITKIGGAAFENCVSLEYADLNEGLQEIGFWAFHSTKLHQIVIPSTVTMIGNDAFAYVPAEYVYVPASVTIISNIAFGTYDYNKTMTIYCEREYRPSGYAIDWAKNNSVVWGYKGIVEDNGFKYAVSEIEGEQGLIFVGFDSSLTNIEIPSSVGSMPVKGVSGGAFVNNKSVKSVILPNSVTEIPSLMFHGCEELTYVPLPDSITSIGEDAFGGCKKLESFSMPDSVTSIGRAIFGDCYNLKFIKLSNNITELTDQMFVNCDSLEYVDIPDSVTFISSRAFDNCDMLTSVTMSSAIETIENSAFTYSWNISKIYCKCSEEKWNSFMSTYSHDYDNLYLATAYFYSETSPTETGNYWHYSDIDGKPAIW